MIYEYAISPLLIADFGRLDLFSSSLGAEHGRLISDIPRKKWVRLARKAILESDNKDVARKKLSVCLDRLARNALFRRNAAPTGASDDWIDQALAAHADRPFRAILTDIFKGEEAFVLANDVIFSEEPLWKVPMDAYIERSAQEMIIAIQPMIDCAREVVLVDRNFDPEKFRWRPFLEELAGFLSKRLFSPSISKIAFHLGDKIATDHIQNLCENHFAANLPGGLRLEFHIWPWDELHDRYVLTDIGGVRFGIGLDIDDGNGQQKVEISRISSETHSRWWRRCKSHASSFTIS